MGEAFDRYLNTLTERRIVEQDNFIRQQQAQQRVAQGIQNAAQAVQDRQSLVNEYKFRATQKGLFDENAMEAQTPTEQRIAGLKQKIIDRQTRLKDLGEKASQAPQSQRQARIFGKIVQEEAKLQDADRKIAEHQSNPNYQEKVSQVKWRQWLKENPIESGAFFKAFTDEPEADPMAEFAEKERIKTQESLKRKSGGSGVDRLEQARETQLDELSKRLQGLRGDAFSDVDPKELGIVSDAIAETEVAKTEAEINAAQSKLLKALTELYGSEEEVAKKGFKLFPKKNLLSKHRK